MPTLLYREKIKDFAVHPTIPKTLSVEVESGVLLSNIGASITGIPDSANYGSAQVLPSTQTVGPFAVPGIGKVKKDLIVISTDLTLHVLTGTAVASPGPAVAPVFPASLIPLAEISLTDVTTEIGTAEIQDVRPFLASHQDRTRSIRIESLLLGTAFPTAGTSGDFTTVVFASGVDQDVKFSITVPEDFDYNREMHLKLRGFTGGAGSTGNIQWDVRVTRIALGAGAGAFPPGGAITKNYVIGVDDDFSYEYYDLKIADPSSTSHFALRALLPGDLLSFVVIRKGTSASDTYTGSVDIVEVTIDYNVGFSVYPG